MDIFNDPVALVRRYNAFVYGPDVPAAAIARLQTIPGTPADIITQGAEILYAHWDLLNIDGRTVVGQLYAYASSQGWSQFCADGRCDQIVAAVRGELGEIDKPDPATLPEPNTALRDDGVNWKPQAKPEG